MSPALSPSGDKLLYVEPGMQSEETIVVVDLAAGGAPQGVMIMNEGQARIDRCRWATEERIICRLYGYNDTGTVLFGFTRLVSMKSDGTEFTHLTPKTDWNTQGLIQDGGSWLALDLEGDDNKILMTRQYVKENSSLTRLYSDQEGLGVDSVDVTNGRRRTVERPNRTAVSYLADEHGKVRVMAVREKTADRLRRGRFQLPLSSCRLRQNGMTFQKPGKATIGKPASTRLQSIVQRTLLTGLSRRTATSHSIL